MRPVAKTAAVPAASAATGRWTRGSRAAWGGLVIVAVEGLVALVFGPQPFLVACLLALVPGLALTPFLPRELAAPAVRVTVIPLVGLATASIAIITASTLAVPLTSLSIRLLLAAVAVAGVVASARFGSGREASQAVAAARSGEGTVLVLLGAVLCLGITLEALIVGGKPLPGQDWGHYLVYADQIRQQHSLLINNPYWMGGGKPFLEDPGVPALYGAYVLLSSQATSVLIQGIWVFAALGILSVFTFTAVLWGAQAGLVAAGLYAAVPMNLDILAWHGLATVYALTILPLVLLALGMMLRRNCGARWSAFLALGLVALAAAHRLTFLVALLTLVPCLGVALWQRFRETTRFIVWTVIVAAVVGAGVIADLARRNADTKGVEDYRAYLPTKVNWDLVGRDLTSLLGVMGAVALVLTFVLRPLRRDAARFVLYFLLAAILALTYAWVVHFPMGYYRPSYYLPLLLAVAVGVAWSRLIPRLMFASAAVIVLVALQARDLAPALRNFYSYANRGSLTGLDYVKTLSQRRDVIVTDTCWGFLAEWLLKQPILAAEDPSLILPKTEVEPALVARRILYGGESGARLAKRIGVRFALVDPQCTHQTGQPVAPPDIGTPIFASTRLVVLDLRDGPSAARPVLAPAEGK